MTYSKPVLDQWIADEVARAKVLDHAAHNHGDREIVTRCVETGAIERTTYAGLRERAKQVSSALIDDGIFPAEPTPLPTISWSSRPMLRGILEYLMRSHWKLSVSFSCSPRHETPRPKTSGNSTGISRLLIKTVPASVFTWFL